MQPEDSPPPPSASTPSPGAKPATLLEVASAVFWSFFGVRKGRHMLQDTTTIKPLHVVIVGLLSGLVFVLVLIVLVNYIIRSAA